MPQTADRTGAKACLICGKLFASVGHHVAVAHGMSARDYRDMHGIPRSAKLTSPEVSEKFAAQAIARGLPDGVVHLAPRAAEYAAIGKQAKADLSAAGRKFSAWNAIPRDLIAAIVAEAEAGGRPYQIVRAMGISWSGFHGALTKFPDLLARYKSLPIRRGRKGRARQAGYGVALAPGV